MLEKNLTEQLQQLKSAGLRGVWSGDLIDKTSTRELVRLGLADNTGGSPSSLNRVYISKAGRDALAATQ
jgi:hypothetical protein